MGNSEDIPYPDRASHGVCPKCGTAFDPRWADFMPFCSRRCKTADLGQWLDERYSMPLEIPEEDELA